MNRYSVSIALGRAEYKTCDAIIQYGKSSLQANLEANGGIEQDSWGAIIRVFTLVAEVMTWFTSQ